MGRRSHAVAANVVLIGALLAGAVTAAPASATARAATTASKTVWLCRPGLADDPCTADRTATLVAAAGSTRIQRPVTKLINSLGATWGLHLVDVNIDQGDLVALVGRQGQAWAAHH